MSKASYMFARRLGVTGDCTSKKKKIDNAANVLENNILNEYIRIKIMFWLVIIK